MASDLFLAPVLYRCYYCQFESTENSFKYFDNKKVDQPRHQCHNCHKLFTLGSHGRPQGRTYAKKRNEDPEELKSLSRECRHCGVADNAPFKYYNNNNHLQPRFKCLSCGKQFQMRLMGTGDEMRLVHTSCNPRQATGRCKKLGVAEASTNTSNFGVQKNYQPSDDGSFMPLPFDPLMPLEPGMRLLPETCGEDEQFASFLETELTDETERYASFLETELTDDKEQAPNADPISCNANVDNGLLPELSTEEAQLLALLEFESSTNENEQAPNADPINGILNEDDGLPLGLSAAKNAEFLSFFEAGFLTNGNEAPNVVNVDNALSAPNVDELPPWFGNDADLLDFGFMDTSVRADESNDVVMLSESTVAMDSDCTFNPEVVSGPLFVETLAPTPPDSWSNDTIKDSFEPELPGSCCSPLQFYGYGPFEFHGGSPGAAW